jgi:hypothetical protein
MWILLAVIVGAGLKKEYGDRITFVNRYFPLQ